MGVVTYSCFRKLSPSLPSKLTVGAVTHLACASYAPALSAAWLQGAVVKPERRPAPVS